MDNSVCADKIIDICNELKALLSNDGAFTFYVLNLFGKLQRLSLQFGSVREDAAIDLSKFAGGHWVTSDDGHKIYVDKDGNPVAGNPYVLEAISGAANKKAAEEATAKRFPRKGDMVCEKRVEFDNPGRNTKDSLGRTVTHFNHDEDIMEVTRQVKVEDALGDQYKICREPIEHLTVFAADGVGRGLDVAEKLAEQSGGSAVSWKHVKGIGTVVDKNGQKRKADIHWFESPESGQVGWKIKRFADDMNDEDKYWEERDEGRNG